MSVCKYIHMEYYSATKKKNILPFMIIWMNLKDIMLRETSQTQKEKYYVISPTCAIYKSQTLRNR